MAKHNWEKYVDTSSEYWTKLQALYAANEYYPKKVVSHRNLHHKFLRSWSKTENEEIDNDDDNLVSLGLGDHFLAHWLLWKCSNTGWKRYTSRAVHFMFKNSIKYLTYEAADIIAEEWNEVERDLSMSEEAKMKISKANKGKKLGPRSEESKRKQSEAQKGRKLSEEHKRKLSKARKGKTFSEEWCKKLSESRKGKAFSEETKKRIKENNAAYWKGKKLPEKTRRKLSEVNKGKTLSEETRRKMSESRKGKKRGPYKKKYTTK